MDWSTVPSYTSPHSCPIHSQKLKWLGLLCFLYLTIRASTCSPMHCGRQIDIHDHHH